MHGPALLAYLRTRLDEMLESLATLVAHESPSRDSQATNVLARLLAGRFERLGAAVELVPNPGGGDHVVARFGPPGSAPPAFVVGHFDTVWPVGTLAAQPFRIDGDRAYGPGTFDMKASIVLVESALSALRALNLETPRQAVVLFTSDEEVGSPGSRPLIESLAARCAHVLVMEPALPGGALKTARKGVGEFHITVEGRAAHAGVEPEKGISAITELALQVPRINALADPRAGTTVNIGVIDGGTARNVVPALARAHVDIRATTMDEARRLESSFKALRPVTPGATLRVEGGFNRPPMERTPAIARLFDRARAIARTIPLELDEGPTGGGSDGNFTAAIGVATLDGLGARGAGAHAADEHVIIDSLPERAALLACLLLEL